MFYSIKASLNRIFAILKKEFTQLLRDRSTFAMIAAIPIVQLLLFGYAINNNPKHLKTVLIDKDNSIVSRNFMVGLQNSQYFDIIKKVYAEQEAQNLLQKGEVYFIINIPQNFSADLLTNKTPEILIQADASDPTAIGGAVASLEGVLASTITKDSKPNTIKLQQSPVNIIVHKLYNPEGLTSYNIIPGLIGIILMITGIMITSVALTKEKEQGTMENLLAMPTNGFEVMIGKISPYILICYIQASIILVLAKVLFSVSALGSLGLLYFTLLIFIICNLCIGFCISSVSKNQTQASQMATMVFLPSMLLAGFLFPFSGMPLWAQSIGNLLPLTYFLKIARSIILKGATFMEIWPNLWPLLIFMIAIITLTSKFYKKTLD